MTKFLNFLVLLLITSACGSGPGPNAVKNNLAVSHRFIDAFYSFQRDSLQPLLADAPASQPEILYYQQWAKCANYQVLDRSHINAQNDSVVLCPVTVKDDLMGSLGIKLNVTDTFHVTLRQGKIVSVKTSSNDVPEYYRAKEWVKKNRPSYIDRACEGIWAGGPTPCDCVLGMIKGFREFRGDSIRTGDQ